MTAHSRMQRIYPWLVAAFVLVPALVAWQLQRTQRIRDQERFRQEIRSQSPRLLASAGPCQDLANQVLNHVAREKGDWAGLDASLDEWRLRAPAALGYGHANWAGGKLTLAHQTLGEGEPRHATETDLLELPAVREAWAEMLREGKGTATRPLAWLRDDPRPLVLVLRIVYEPGPPPASEAARRATARGLAFCVLDQERVWNDGLGRIDRRTLTAERMPEDAPLEKRDFTRTIGLGVGGGYTWKIRFTPGPDFFAAQNWRAPALVTAVGVFLAGLTFALARSQARRRDEIESLNRGLDARVAALTEALQNENARLRAAQVETERALAREQESGELKTRIVTTISHEFRTPLSVILSSAEILRNYSDRLDPARRAGHLAAIEEAVGGMSSLIQSVLAFGKAGAGRMEFRPERLAPGDFIREVVDEVLSATSRRCPINLQDCRLEEPAWIDATLLRLILVNLLGNAVKYSAAGSPVELLARRVGDELVLVVADRGIGIPPEDQKSLFQSFRRGRNTHGIPGTGLGLSIVKTCVELHLGRIEASSTPDTGTTFTVTLPAYAPPPPSRAASSVPFAPPPAPPSP